MEKVTVTCGSLICYEAACSRSGRKEGKGKAVPSEVQGAEFVLALLMKGLYRFFCFILFLDAKYV